MDYLDHHIIRFLVDEDDDVLEYYANDSGMVGRLARQEQEVRADSLAEMLDICDEI